MISREGESDSEGYPEPLSRELSYSFILEPLELLSFEGGNVVWAERTSLSSKKDDKGVGITSPPFPFAFPFDGLQASFASPAFHLPLRPGVALLISSFIINTHCRAHTSGTLSPLKLKRNNLQR